MSDLYYTGNSRGPEQTAEMERLERDGVCIFCPDALEADPAREIVHRTAHWRITTNEYPYAGARLHLMLVPASHVHDLVELDDAARADFWTALDWLHDAHDLRFYGLAARCGDCRYTGGTVRHLHVHVIVGDVDDPGHSPVRLKLSSRPDPSRSTNSTSQPAARSTCSPSSSE